MLLLKRNYFYIVPICCHILLLESPCPLVRSSFVRPSVTFFTPSINTHNRLMCEVTDKVTDEVADEVADEVTDEVAIEVTDEVADEVTDMVPVSVVRDGGSGGSGGL